MGPVNPRLAVYVETPPLQRLSRTERQRIGLPDIEGKEVIRQMRGWSEMPIIVLSARDREEEKVAALFAH